MEDWAEIRRLSRAEGMTIKGIARALGIGRASLDARASTMLAEFPNDV